MSMKLISLQYCDGVIYMELWIKNAACKNKISVLIPLPQAFIIYFKFFANITPLEANKCKMFHPKYLRNNLIHAV